LRPLADDDGLFRFLQVGGSWLDATCHGVIVVVGFFVVLNVKIALTPLVPESLTLLPSLSRKFWIQNGRIGRGALLLVS
jgi:hypothetical protein